LVYLNQVDAGGETYFPRLNIKQAPEFGSMLVFSNVKDGKRLPDPLSLHGAAPVKKGEKWAFNLWFRERKTGV
jgi:prolyl 4-hydroxylase